MILYNRKSIINGFIWLFLQKISAQAVSFIVTIILARLLEPKIFGLVAIVTVFNTVLGVFVDSGLCSALIQKKDADDIDFSSVFYFNVLFCILLYLLIFLVAPLIASFYSMDELTLLIRVLCLSLVVNSFRNVQQAYVTRNILFKKFFFATLIGTIVGAFIGISMAYSGYGVWALVAYILVRQTIDTFIIWITVMWCPKFSFSFDRIKILLSFSWKLLLASLMNVLYLNLRQLVIGKIYTTEDLAFYNRGDSFPKLFVTNINNSLANILFPVMSQKQDDKIAIKSIVRRSILLSTYVLMPIMMGLGVCATPFIKFLLTEKWLFCIPYLRIFCFEYALILFYTTNLMSYQSVGRSDIYLKCELITKVIGLVTIFVTAHISVFVLALSGVFVAIVSVIISTMPNKELINYGFLDQIKDVFSNLGLTLVMGIVISLIGLLNISDLILLCLQVFVGIVIYVWGSQMLKLEAYDEVLKTLKIYYPVKR